MRTNKKILKAILEHFGYDPDDHCEDPPPPKTKAKVSKKRAQTNKPKAKISKRRVETEDNPDDPNPDVANDLNNSIEEDISDKTDRLKEMGVLRTNKRKRQAQPDSSSSSSSSDEEEQEEGPGGGRRRLLVEGEEEEEEEGEVPGRALGEQDDEDEVEERWEGEVTRGHRRGLLEEEEEEEEDGPPTPTRPTPPAQTTPPRAAPTRSPSPFITPPSPFVPPAPQSPPAPAPARGPGPRTQSSTSSEGDLFARRSTRRKWYCTANCGKSFGTQRQMLVHLRDCQNYDHS